MNKYSFINSFTDQKYILCSKNKPRLEVEKCVNIKIRLYTDYLGLNKPGVGSRIALSSQLPNVVVLDNLPSRKMIFWQIFCFQENVYPRKRYRCSDYLYCNNFSNTIKRE